MTLDIKYSTSAAPTRDRSVALFSLLNVRHSDPTSMTLNWEREKDREREERERERERERQRERQTDTERETDRQTKKRKSVIKIIHF